MHGTCQCIVTDAAAQGNSSQIRGGPLIHYGYALHESVGRCCQASCAGIGRRIFIRNMKYPGNCGVSLIFGTACFLKLKLQINEKEGIIMSTVQTRIGKVTRRTFETCSLVILIVLLALPFTRAFADDRYGRGGPGFFGAANVEGWRLGGAYRNGGYEIWRWYRGDWRRMPGRGVQLGGSSRSPWVINSEGERYQWTGRDWRFVGYASGRGFNRRNYVPDNAFRNGRGNNHWNDYRGNRNGRYYEGRNNGRNVIRQQRNRIERQQDRIQDLRRDLRQERLEDRRDARRDGFQDRRDRVQGRREDRRDRAQDRGGDRREGGPGNNRRGDRDGGSRNGPR